MSGGVQGWSRSIGRILWLAGHDLRLTLKDRSSIVWMLLMPVAFMWLFSHTNAGSTSTELPKISLGVEDRDGGWLARALIDDLSVEHVRLREVGPRPALNLATDGDEASLDEASPDGASPDEASPDEDRPARILVIPAGFTRGALAGEQQILQLRAQSDANASYTLAAQALITRASLRLVARLVELAAVPLEEGAIEEEPIEDALQDADVSGRLTPQAFARLAERPAKVDLAVSVAGRGQPVPSGAAQSVPGTLTFIVLMMTLIYGAIFLTQERRQGMLRRQASLPLRPFELLLGKLGGRLLIASVQIVVLLTLGHLLFGVSWGHHLGALVAVLFSYALSVAGLSLLLGAVVSTTEQASSLGWILSMILGSLGGCWWPSEIMPEWLQTLAFAFPTAWAMDAFHALISFGRGWEAVWLPSLVLLGFGFASTYLGARKLRYD